MVESSRAASGIVLEAAETASPSCAERYLSLPYLMSTSRPPIGRAEFARLLARSAALEVDLRALLQSAGPTRTAREALVRILATLAFDHGCALRLLLGQDLGDTALAHVRPQFEATLRALWAATAATDAEIRTFLEVPPGTSPRSLPQGPSVDAMLRATQSGPAAGLAHALAELKNASWIPMHHFVHSGFLAVTQAINDEPNTTLHAAALNSNALAILCCNVALVCSPFGNAAALDRLQRLHAGCLPIHRAAAAAPQTPAPGASGSLPSGQQLQPARSPTLRKSQSPVARTARAARLRSAMWAPQTGRRR